MRASYGARQRPAEPPPWPAPRRPCALGVVCALVAAAAHTAAAGGQEGGGRGAAAVTSISGGNGTWINWEGTVACHPQTLAAATTVEEVARLVAGHARVRTAGLGHSFNDFVCSRDLMLATTGLNQVCARGHRNIYGRGSGSVSCALFHGFYVRPTNHTGNRCWASMRAP